MDREMGPALPDLPVEYPRTRKELVEAATADDRLRPKLMRPYRDGGADGWVYATDGHVLLQCPANGSILDMEFYGEEQWEGWHEEFRSMLSPPDGGEVVDLIPLLNTLEDVRTTDRHKYYECDNCGHEIQGPVVGQTYAPSAVIHWRDQFWKPRLLTQAVVGAVAAEKRIRAIAYPIENPDLTNPPMILDVGEVRMGIMMMEVGAFDSCDFYNVG